MSPKGAADRPPRHALLAELGQRLADTEIRDQPRLRQRVDRLARAGADAARFEQLLAEVERDIAQSGARVAARRSAPVQIRFDPALPITAHVREITEALECHPVIVVCGETGSGKSTQLPKICLAAGRGTAGLIGHTQPRRIAARALADRIAFEIGVTLGAEVGYQVRFTDRTGPRARVKLMTDGILLRELERDRELRRYDTLIIDEAHERSLNVDFLLGYLKQIAPRRDDLRVVITSATIEPDRFAAFFGAAPVINVSGRGYPVEIRYRPLARGDEDDDDELTLVEGVTQAVAELAAISAGVTGDMLVFLPGEKQIRESAIALERHGGRGLEILALFARQSAAEQARVFAPHAQPRVILATNVAETSLTVPGVRYVIDSGLARISRYSPRARVQRLPIEPVSQASAEQRAGRCGREAPGICIRLYAEEDYATRERQTPPEVLRTSLASVILQMAVLGLGEPEQFPFMDPPDTRLVGDGYRLLEELGAVDAARRVTRLGRDLAALPVDPRLARMLIAASREGCLSEMLILSAFLSIQDPRERGDGPTAQEIEAEVTAIQSERSDFVTVLNLWSAYNEFAAGASGSALRRWCRKRSLAYLRMREWQDLVAQLTAAVEDLGLTTHAQPAGYRELHQAILSGFLGQIGQREERREYVAARGQRFVIAPGTPLARRPPSWLVAGSLIETTRIYARIVAAVEPAWIESVARSLLKRTYSEPHWIAARGFVAAWETTRLYGLVLNARRRINYGPVEPAEARQIFVMHALVLRESRIEAPFLAANSELQRQIEDIEARLRRRDVLVDEGARAAFYSARIPLRISSVAAFERWRLEAERADPRLLSMTRADLMAREVDAAELAGFPDTWHSAGNEFPLHYRFEPGAAEDGVTLIVPEAFVAALDAGRLAWHVPGVRLEKIAAVLRALPKSVRRRLVPVPDYARLAIAEIETEGCFHDRLAAWLVRTTGETITGAMLEQLPLPDHLSMNVRVIDGSGHTIASGRRLADVRRRVGLSKRTPAVNSVVESGVDVHRSWSFGDLPPYLEVERGSMKLTVYPGLEDTGHAVQRAEFATLAAAEAGIRRGVRRLAMLALPQQHRYARKAFADRRELILLGSALRLGRPLPDLLAERTFRECFDPDDVPPPRSEAGFLDRLESGRGQFGTVVDRLAAQVETALRELHEIRQRLADLESAAYAEARTDIETQLGRFFPDDFPLGLTQRRIAQLPRYLAAVNRRITKLRGAAERDRRSMRQVAPYVAGLDQLERRAAAEHKPRVAELTILDDMIEEYRVSLYAQELGTAVPVSGKRLAAQLEQARAAVQRG